MTTTAQVIARLVKRIERLEGKAESSLRRGAVRHQRQTRLAMTKAAEGLSYPTEGSAPSTYPFVFLDGEYERVQGPGSLVKRERQSHGDALLHNLAHPTYIPENTLLSVFWEYGLDGEKYWFAIYRTNTAGGSGGTDTFAVVVQGALTADMSGSTPRAAAATFDEVYATTTNVPGCTDATTGSVTAVADSGDGKAKVTIGSHSITVGQGILLASVSSEYNGWWRVLAVTATTVTIDAQYGSAASSGTWSSGGSAISVIDPTNYLWKYCLDGARFTAVWQRATNEWHAIWVERPADVIEFEVAYGQDFTMESATATVTFRKAYDGVTGLTSGDPVTVRNPLDHGGDFGGTYLFFGDEDHTGRAYFDWEAGAYVIHDMYGCGSTVDDLRSEDGNNAVQIGSDGLLFVDEDARSTDSDNLMSEGSDGLASLTSGDINSTGTSNNLMTAAADGLALTASDVVDVEADNLASVGPNAQVYVDPVDVQAGIPHEDIIQMSIDGSQSVTTSSTKLTFNAALGADAAWNFDAANDELEYTGSPDRVEVKIHLTHVMAAAGADLRFTLKRGASTAATGAYKPGDTLTHPGLDLTLTDYSPGTDPVYTIEHLCGSSTATISSTSLYQEYVEAKAVYR